MYDALYQVQNAYYGHNPSQEPPSQSNSELAATYDYDVMGNRQYVHRNALMDEYLQNEYNDLNQYEEVIFNTQSHTVAYDANGNMTQLGNKAFTYDARNRMIKAQDDPVNPTMEANYQYDSMNRRISKTVGSSTIKYCYDGGQIIAEYDGANTLLRRFVYGPGIDEPICMIAYNSGGTETGRYFYHYDGQGNIVGLSNSSGNLVEQYKYDVYGLVTIYDGGGTPLTQSACGNPYYFTGRELDNETGLYYYRARMYEPQLGRFMQPDPIGYADGMNLYAYCGNNPVNFVDPWGYFRFGRTGMVGALPYSRYYIQFGYPFTNYLNLGYYHEAGWYEDGSGDYASYGETTETENVDEYDISPWQYDDDTMRKAQCNVDGSGKFDDKDFGIFHNCQDYCSALRKEYKRLGGKVKFKPFNRRANLK